MQQLSKLQQQAAEYLSQQQYSEASNLYEQSIEADPSVMLNYWYLGLALLLQGQEEEAQMTWLSAIAQEEVEQVEVRKAELLEVLVAEAKRHQAASHLYEAWLIHQYIGELSPDNFNNLLATISLSLELELFSPQGETALLQATKLVLLDNLTEVDGDLLFQVLNKLLETHIYSDFIDICLLEKEILTEKEQLNILMTKLALANNELGVSFYQGENYYVAETRFCKALNFEVYLPASQRASINYNLGLTLVKQAKFEKAAIHFNKAVELDPGLTQASYQLKRLNYEINNRNKGYQFSTDWFSRNIEILEEHLTKLANKPGIKMLEIGSWEGRSTCWLLENILTHESAKITCIDTFQGSIEHKIWYEDSYINSVEQRFDFNTSKTQAAEKVQKLVGSSQTVMRTLPLNSYDIVYIDGSHLACDVLADAVLCWDLVKPGGAIIFDDYDFGFSDNPSQNTKNGIDAFISVFSEKLKVLHQSHQVVIEKL